MTWFQIAAIFGAPLVFLVFGLSIYLPNRPRNRHAP